MIAQNNRNTWFVHDRIMIKGDDECGVADEEEFTLRTIPAATWAVFTSIGPMPGAIQQVWSNIFQEWFPSTGYQHSGRPELEVYPAGDTTAEDYQCEI
ncbi:hypothetical protein EIZ39_11120 [Ammoniphilus sp. CFH 90114]|nr:hypothetical protein EIZ39_11120 [Ammoniphilus sp. CFH 90114]